MYVLKRSICCGYSKEAYVVGTQKNHLNETVLLSTQNIMLKLMGKKIFTILRANKCVYLKSVTKTYVLGT